MNDTDRTPHQTYSARAARACERLAVLNRRFDRIANLRLAVAFAGLALAVVTLTSPAVSANWLFLPAAFFLSLVVVHARSERGRRLAALQAEFYERGLSRLDHTWPGKGIPGTAFLSEDHPYAADLDLFGPASLFELLCTARTRAGEEALARWLRAPADTAEIIERQEAVEELRPDLDLREELAIQGGGIRSLIDPARLTAWGEAPPFFSPLTTLVLRLCAFIGSAGLLASLVLWALAIWGPLPFWLFLLALWGLFSLKGYQIQKSIQALEEPRRELRVLALTLRRLESYPVTSPRLRALTARFSAGGLTASRAIRRLDQLIQWLDASRNMLFAPVAWFLMWPLHFALAIEAWRLEAGPSIRRWLEALGEYEVLCALASYAWEHPGDPWPELADDGPVYAGDDLGHPLLPESNCVPNNVRLDAEIRAWVVSGSNMSGKSTLLRTVGINAVLAFAGAPVRARRLRLSPLAIGATIRLEDSLQAGRSRFYAEISRLKQLLDLARGDRPLLFLLDEILHGTNSHDRGVGSAAIVRSLVGAGAIGLVTTHDLALTRVAGEMDGRVVNMHFRDELRAGELFFDYRVRPGILERGNALDLMRSVGLDV